MVNRYVNISGRDFLSIFYIGAVILSVIYATTYICYVIYVVLHTNFKYGFYRNDLKPGVFIDDRYDYMWWFLMINNVRILLLPALLWIFQDLRIGIMSYMSNMAFSLMVFIDFLLILVWFIIGCFFCNNGVFRNGLCDTNNITAYCEVWWKDQVDLCEPPMYNTSLQQCDLKTNPAYIKYIFFLLGFLILDIITVGYISLVRKTAPEIFLMEYYRNQDNDNNDTDDDNNEVSGNEVEGNGNKMNMENENLNDNKSVATNNSYISTTNVNNSSNNNNQTGKMNYTNDQASRIQDGNLIESLNQTNLPTISDLIEQFDPDDATARFNVVMNNK